MGAAASLLVMPAARADEHQGHQGGPEEHGEAYPERGGDDQACPNLILPLDHQENRARRNHDREQRQQPENPQTDKVPTDNAELNSRRFMNSLLRGLDVSHRAAERRIGNG